MAHLHGVSFKIYCSRKMQAHIPYGARQAVKKIIKQILTSRVYEAAVETSLDEAVSLPNRPG